MLQARCLLGATKSTSARSVELFPAPRVTGRLHGGGGRGLCTLFSEMCPKFGKNKIWTVRQPLKDLQGLVQITLMILSYLRARNILDTEEPWSGAGGVAVTLVVPYLLHRSSVIYIINVHLFSYLSCNVYQEGKRISRGGGWDRRIRKENKETKARGGYSWRCRHVSLRLPEVGSELPSCQSKEGNKPFSRLKLNVRRVALRPATKMPFRLMPSMGSGWGN